MHSQRVAGAKGGGRGSDPLGEGPLQGQSREAGVRAVAMGTVGSWGSLALAPRHPVPSHPHTWRTLCSGLSASKGEDKTLLFPAQPGSCGLAAPQRPVCACRHQGSAPGGETAPTVKPRPAGKAPSNTGPHRQSPSAPALEAVSPVAAEM